MDLNGSYEHKSSDDDDTREFAVLVDWIHTNSLDRIETKGRILWQSEQCVSTASRKMEPHRQHLEEPMEGVVVMTHTVRTSGIAMVSRS